MGTAITWICVAGGLLLLGFLLYRKVLVPRREEREWARQGEGLRQATAQRLARDRERTRQSAPPKPPK